MGDNSLTAGQRNRSSPCLHASHLLSGTSNYCWRAALGSRQRGHAGDWGRGGQCDLSSDAEACRLTEVVDMADGLPDDSSGLGSRDVNALHTDR